MNTFFICGGSLFDFDLTFFVELLLFTILALVVTNSFINPISERIKLRAEFMNYTSLKSMILLSFGSSKLSNCIGIVTKQVNELNRQLKDLQAFSNRKFEDEIKTVQLENLSILTRLRGTLTVKSAILFSNITIKLQELSDQFFKKKLIST